MRNPLPSSPTAPLPQEQTKAQTRHLHRFVVTLIIGIAGILLAPEPIRRYIWTNVLEHKLLALFFLIFVVLALTVVWSLGARLDDLVFKFLNKYARISRFADGLMSVLTQFGNGLVALLIAAAFFAFGQRLFAFQFIFGTISVWLTVELAKLLIGRKRPYFGVEEMRIVGSKAIGYSFPSGHTSQAFFMASMLSTFFQLPWYLALLLYVLAALTGITRIYLGAHYPRDVVAGALLGTIWGYFTSVLYGVVTSWFG